MPRVIRSNAIRFVVSTFIAWALWGTTTFGQDSRDRELPGGAAAVPGSLASSRYLPPARPPGVFKLGILARNCPTGVILNQVLAGSVAERSGLEAGDIIVAVDGYQVGLVSGRLYDLGDELARRVDDLGRVTLLVQSRRDARLVNVDVLFPPQSRVITGSVLTQPQNLGRDARLTVRVLDVTQAHWRGVVIAEVTQDAPQRWPSPYRLETEAAHIRAGHQYAVEARLTERGQIVRQTAQPQRITISETGATANLTLVTPGRPPANGISPYDQIRRWYEQYLGRRPSDREVSAWQADLDRGRSIDDVEAGILSSSEFYDRQTNNRDRFVDEVYRQLNGQAPTQEQHQLLIEQLKQHGDLRNRFTHELLRSRSESVPPNANR